MHKPLRFKDYSSRKFLVSVLLGLATMVIFYLFQQYLFVLYRSVLLAFKFNANHLLSEDIGNLVEFVFAGNAVILGNSVGIAYYISGVSKNIKSRSRKRNILNNQSFLIGSHFFLFIKAEISIGVVLLSFFNLDIQDLIWSIFILLFIVLFLESVKELRRSFKGYTIKVLLFHFLLITALLFACTFCNKSGYYKTGIIYNTSYPYVSVPTTTLPVSYIDREVILGYNMYERVPVKILSNSGKLIYTIHNDTLTLDELLNAPYNEKYNYSFRFHRVADLNLYANGDVVYKSFKELERKATMKEMSKIQYVVYSKNKKREFIYSKYLYPTKEMLEDSTPPLPVRFMYFETTFKDRKEICIALDTFKIKNQIDQKKVYTFFKESVSDSVFFNLKINKEITLQQYLDFMISYKQSVYDLRDEQRNMNEALNIYKEFQVKEKFPFFIYEEVE